MSFGNASGKVEPFPLLRLSKKSAFVTRPTLLDYVSTREELLGRINEIFKWVNEGKLDVCIDMEFPLEKAAEAHHYVEAGKTKGKSKRWNLENLMIVVHTMKAINHI